VSRRALLALALAVLALGSVLSACGGSSGDDGPEAPEIGGDYGPFFGIAPNETPDDADLARMTAGGIGSYHVLLSWQTVESEKGTYDWSGYDAEFRRLAQFGIEPIPYVIGTPAAYEDSASTPPTADPEAFDAWAKFLKEAVGRYGPDGVFWQAIGGSEPDIVPQPPKVWEIWNEPNSSVFWQPAPDPAAYAELLKRSSRVIKGVDPAAQIMTAGMFITPQSDGAINSLDFLRQVYDHNGVDDAVDVIGVHPYGPTSDDVIDQVDKTREVADDVDPDASLWVTEIGWGSDPSSGNDLAKTPEEQADLLDESLGTLLERRDELKLDGVVWFTWRDVDIGVECAWCSSAGLVDADRDSKPAWLAFTDLSGGDPE
jgi:polysaccharide biosynthesis protein PslG